MMINFLRKGLELFRVIPRSYLVVKITPSHPTPEQIVPGKMIIVRDGVDKWACFLCPGECGETIKLSLSKNRRPRWTAVPDWLKRPTIYPSVRQTNNCRCHFWVRRGRIDWSKDNGHKRVDDFESEAAKPRSKPSRPQSLE